MDFKVVFKAFVGNSLVNHITITLENCERKREQIHTGLIALKF